MSDEKEHAKLTGMQNDTLSYNHFIIVRHTGHEHERLLRSINAIQLIYYTIIDFNEVDNEA